VRHGSRGARRMARNTSAKDPGSGVDGKSRVGAECLLKIGDRQ
jgi:hypothetical protein